MLSGCTEGRGDIPAGAGGSGHGDGSIYRVAGGREGAGSVLGQVKGEGAPMMEVVKWDLILLPHRKAI